MTVEKTTHVLNRLDDSNIFLVFFVLKARIYIQPRKQAALLSRLNVSSKLSRDIKKCRAWLKYFIKVRTR